MPRKSTKTFEMTAIQTRESEHRMCFYITAVLQKVTNIT